VPPPEDLAAFCVSEYPRLVRALSLYCGSREEAEDAAQDALVRVCERWRTVATMASPGGWAFRVATNQIRSGYRRSRTAARALARTGAPEVHVGDVAEIITLREAVARLPKRQRQVLLLRHTFSLSTEEAADVMGISSLAVRSLTHRAVTTLRADLFADTAPERTRGGRDGS
jgi:RNA polymerase sigma factor (sigma-70 family)